MHRGGGWIREWWTRAKVAHLEFDMKISSLTGSLRAQYGTTKYCAAYLRNENCTNKSCMFLHEPGEEKDSFTRQDLSSLNAVSTQRPAQGTAQASSSAPSGAANRHGQPQPQPPLQHAPLAAAALARDSSKDGTSPIENADGSALPSSASWATRGVQQGSRRGSRAPSTSTPSPRVNHAAIGSRVQVEQKQEAPVPEDDPEDDPEEAAPSQPIEPPPDDSSHRPTEALVRPNVYTYKISIDILNPLLESLGSPNFRFTCAKVAAPGYELDALLRYPSFLAYDGGAKLELIRAGQARLRNEELLRKMAQATGRAEAEGVLESGSLQLGGEPEARQMGEGGATVDPAEIGARDPRRQPIQPPSYHPLSALTAADAGFVSGHPSINALSNLVMNGRGITSAQPSQQQQSQHVLMKGNNQPSANLFDQYPGTLTSAQQTQADAFRPAQQLTAQSHARQTSRFSFANDSGSATATVKPVANTRFMAQQASMMPGTAGNNAHVTQNHHAQHVGNQMYGNTMPIPPPGLKSATGTPVSGGGLFGQGQGFGGNFNGAPGFGVNMSHADEKSEMLREMLRTRQAAAAGVGAGQAADAGKREFTFPLFPQFPSGPGAAPASGISGAPLGPQSGAHQDQVLQRHRKKGKRQRHANTSSGGGGGVVDLADPSILHARMQQQQQQQQQGNSGLGQGLYGGHAQGGFNPVSALYGGGINRW